MVELEAGVAPEVATTPTLLKGGTEVGGQVIVKADAVAEVVGNQEEHVVASVAEDVDEAASRMKHHQQHLMQHRPTPNLSLRCRPDILSLSAKSHRSSAPSRLSQKDIWPSFTFSALLHRLSCDLGLEVEFN